MFELLDRLVAGSKSIHEQLVEFSCLHVRISSFASLSRDFRKSSRVRPCYKLSTTCTACGRRTRASRFNVPHVYAAMPHIEIKECEVISATPGVDELHNIRESDLV
jgi:hypothetical protein